MEQIGFYDTATHLVSLILEGSELQVRSARIILDGLLTTHSHSLMAEVELIINFRPLIVETISDSKSEIPFSPSNLLALKTSVFMSPPGEFSKPDAHSKRKW